MPCTPSFRSWSTAPSALLMLLAAIPAGAAPGHFDPTFAGDGILEDTSETDGNGLAVQSDGKRLVTVGNGFGVLR